MLTKVMYYTKVAFSFYSLFKALRRDARRYRVLREQRVGVQLEAKGRTAAAQQAVTL